MRAVRSVVVVKALPDRQILLEIHIVFVGQELMELVLVGSMRALDLPVDLWRPGLGVDVFHAVVRDMPVEQSPELALRSIQEGTIDVRLWLSERIGLGSIAEAVSNMSAPLAPVRHLVDPREM